MFGARRAQRTMQKKIRKYLISLCNNNIIEDKTIDTLLSDDTNIIFFGPDSNRINLEY